MSASLYRRLSAALAALALAAPFAGHAAPTSATGMAVVETDGSLTAYVADAIDPERALPTASASPFAVPAPSFQFVQSAPALRNPLSMSLRSSSDAALWNFVAMVNSQQTSQIFDTVDTRVNVVLTLAPPVSAVPLPTATWLMVMVLLGFAGTGLVRRPGSRTGVADALPGGTALAI